MSHWTLVQLATRITPATLNHYPEQMLSPITRRIFRHAMNAYHPQVLASRGVLFLSEDDWEANAFRKLDDTLGASSLFSSGLKVAALIAAGAHDAWASPIVMKKGRPAHTVHVLCDPSATQLIGAVLLRETGSLGLRGTALRRWPQPRTEREVVVDGYTVRAKVALGRVKVEYDDAAAAANGLGRPLREVLAEAAALAERDVQ
jgi:uncharacterized protein (DUF111 family)